MLSTYGANLYAGVMTGQASAPTSFYLALLTTLPDVNDDGTALAAYEPAAGEYDRVFIDTGSPEWSTPVNGVALYQTLITYSPVTDWGTYVAYAFCDAATAGNHIMFGSIGASISAIAGSLLTIPTNTLSIQVM
jgi:hypothetical protein